MMRRVRTVDSLRLVALAAIWGGGFLFMRVAAPEFGAPATAFLRVALGGIALALWFRLSGVSLGLRTHWKTYAIVGLLNCAIPFGLFAFAALHIPAGLSALLNAATPLFGAVFAALWLAEPLTPKRVFGLACGFAGVALVSGARLESASAVVGWAIAAGIAATACYALNGIFMRRFARGVTPQGVSAGSLLAASLLLAPLALAAPPPQWPSLLAIANVVGLALVATAIAFLIFFRLMADVGPTRTLMVTFLIPVFGVGWGALILGESLSPQALAGGALVIVGTLFVLRN